MTKIVALRSDQGTACLETALYGDDDTPEARARIEADAGPDVVRGSWADVSDNAAFDVHLDVDEWRELARGALANCELDPEEASADSLYDECYTLAHDALRDAGCDADLSVSIAVQVAMEVAQP
jgi:hypothetical protein